MTVGDSIGNPIGNTVNSSISGAASSAVSSVSILNRLRKEEVGPDVGEVFNVGDFNDTRSARRELGGTGIVKVGVFCPSKLLGSINVQCAIVHEPAFTLVCDAGLLHGLFKSLGLGLTV